MNHFNELILKHQTILRLFLVWILLLNLLQMHFLLCPPAWSCNGIMGGGEKQNAPQRPE